MPTFFSTPTFMNAPLGEDDAPGRFAILGVPFDAATSLRTGTRLGPGAIRAACAHLLLDPLYPFSVRPAEIDMRDHGDVRIDFGRAETNMAAIEARVRGLVNAGAHCVTLGGDHSITLPILRAHAQKHGPLALVQFDAHQDTWADDGSRVDHGTFVTRAVAEGVIDAARSVQIGIRTRAPATCGVRVLGMEEIDALGIPGTIAAVRETVGTGAAYLSFDIDCLDPAHAPGTGTPVIGGLSSREALRILRGIAGLDWRGMDLVEVAPAYDHAELTAIAGATVTLTYLTMLAERERG